MLGIDAGNTNISFGIFNKKLELANRFELKTKKNEINTNERRGRIIKYDIWN